MDAATPIKRIDNLRKLPGNAIISLVGKYSNATWLHKRFRNMCVFKKPAEIQSLLDELSPGEVLVINETVPSGAIEDVVYVLKL